MLNIKDQVLDALENAIGSFVSGHDLAKKLFVSRNAVWKAVRTLKQDGHDIQAVTNKGYCLSPDSDILTATGINKYLGTQSGNFSVEVYKTIPSTNTLLKERAAHGAPEGTVIVAEEQTSGRGRQGRSFYAPANSGIYFSLLLRPGVSASDATLITTAAAVAAANAIEAVTGVNAQIKWVNDVFCHGKKVCGILTEGAFDMETGGMEYVVLGIGLNITLPETGFPETLTDVAASVRRDAISDPSDRSRLTAEILKRFWDYYLKLSDKSYLEDYKKRSLLIGRDVIVTLGTRTRSAHVLDIDNNCRLVVRYNDGTLAALSSGEARIKPLNIGEVI